MEVAEIMAQVPPPNAEEPEGKVLNLPGRYIKALTDILGISQSELAVRIGISSGSLSTSLYGESGMMRETASEMIKKIELLAIMKNVEMPPGWQLFFSAAILNTGSLDSAELAIRHFEWLARVVQERNAFEKEANDLKSKQFRQRLLAQIQEVRQENERLRTENFKLRKDNEWLRTRGNS